MNCEAELKAAEEYHAHCMGSIDEALGYPRDIGDGDLLSEFVAAIRLLRAIAEEKVG